MSRGKLPWQVRALGDFIGVSGFILLMIFAV